MKNIYEQDKYGHDFFPFNDYDERPTTDEIRRFCENVLPISVENKINALDALDNPTLANNALKGSLMRQLNRWHESEEYKQAQINNATAYIEEVYDSL